MDLGKYQLQSQAALQPGNANQNGLKAPLAEQGKDFRLIKRPTWIPEPNNPQDHRIQPFYENLSASPLARYAVLTKRISGAKSDTLLGPK